LAGIGGGVVMVPFLYLIYRHAPSSVSAQTVVAHATSLGVAFVSSTVGTLRYAWRGVVAWRPAIEYAVPGVGSAFITARLLTQLNAALWVRAVFGAFLIVSAVDMARRARRVPEDHALQAPHSSFWLMVAGFVGGGLSSLLGIGGGLLAVPVLLYVGRLPVQAVSPTALAGVCLTTLAGGASYLTAGTAPPVSPWMAGFIDLRMALPLALGAVCTVPFGVSLHHGASPPRLFWFFAVFFGVMGVLLIREGLGA
jgi:uncharacterized protein